MMNASLEDAVSRLTLSCDSTVAFVNIDTEGLSHTGGIREVAGVDADDPDTFFFDVVTQRPTADAGGLALSDAERTWARVGPDFWRWVGARADTVVLVGHNVLKHDMKLLLDETARVCPSAVDELKRRVFFVDTLDAVLANTSFSNLMNYKQGTIYKHLFGSAPPHAHTALSDARSNSAIAAHPRIAPFVRDKANWVQLGVEPKRTRRKARKQM